MKTSSKPGVSFNGRKDKLSSLSVRELRSKTEGKTLIRTSILNTLIRSYNEKENYSVLFERLVCMEEGFVDQ